MVKDVQWPRFRRGLAWIVPGLLVVVVLGVASDALTAVFPSVINLGTIALVLALVMVALLVLGGPGAVDPRLLSFGLVFVAGALCVVLAGVVFGPRLELLPGIPLDLSGTDQTGVADAIVFPAITAGIVISIVDSLVTRSRRLYPSGGRRWGQRLPASSRVALLLATLGIVSLGGWLLLGARMSGPLLYFGGIGLFGAMLVSLILPERTLPPVVAEGLHRALVSTAEREGSGGNAVYHPDADDPRDVRVYTADAQPPDLDSVESVPSAVQTGESVPTRPAGAALYQSFRSQAVPEVGTATETFAWQLSRGLTDWFELATAATPEVERTGGITVHVEGSTIPDVGGFDHPIVSFLGVALARYRNRPVITDVQSEETGRYRISVHPVAVLSREWEPSPESDIQLRRDRQ